MSAVVGRPDAPLDARMVGALLAIQREGRTADPGIESAAVALGLAFYWRHGLTRLTPAGKRVVREAGER